MKSASVDNVFACSGPVPPHRDVAILYNLFNEGNSAKIIQNIARFHDSLSVGLDSRGATALMLACELGHVEVVQHILVCLDNLAKTDTHNNTPLHYAVHRGSEQCVSILLASFDWTGLDPNAVNSHGNSALHIAVQLGHALCVKQLIRHPSVNVNLQNSYGVTPLILAMSHPNKQNVDAPHSHILRMLLHNQFVDITRIDLNGHNAAHYAAKNGWTEALHSFGEEDKSVLVTADLRGMTPLHEAAYSKQYKAMQFLLTRAGCDANIVCKLGRAPLHWLLYRDTNRIDHRTIPEIREAELKCITCLMKHAAQVNAAEYNGCTPLLIAVEYLQQIKLTDSLDEKCLTALKKVDKMGIEALLEPGKDWSSEPVVAYICYFLAVGADPTQTNLEGKYFMNLCPQHFQPTFEHFIDLFKLESVVACALHGVLGSGAERAEAEVMARPCGHAVVCSQCAPKCMHMQVCHVCNNRIELLMYPDGNPVVFAEVHAAAQLNEVRLQAALQEVDQLRESAVCDICMDLKKSTVLIPCGHTTCTKCCKSMQKCHICRQNITKRQPLYGVY